MYGSTDDEKESNGTSAGKTENIPLVKAGGQAIVDVDHRIQEFMKNPFNEDFSNSDFWDEVTELFGDGKEIGWSTALNKVRVSNIQQRCRLEKKDPLVFLLTDVHDEYVKYANDPQIMSSFKQQLSEFANIIITEDYQSTFDQKNRIYAWPLDIHNEGKKTILHLVAERNLTEIAEIYIGFYPGLVYEPTSGQGLDRLPLELSLLKRYDDVSSFLAKHMLHERVRDLFESNETFDARFQLADIIKDPTMKQTVITILDCCVNADWPYVPVKSGQRKEEAWSKIPDMPLRYHFYYRLLDGDQKSEPAKINNEMNPEFDHWSPSCLQLLADSPHGEDAISHPVIRMLVNRKWEKFGRSKIRLHFLQYVTFLIIMGIALFADTGSHDHRKYTTSLDYFRGTCEILTLCFALFYLVSEIDQMEKERVSYWKDPFNYLDLIGLILIALIVPLRYTDHSKAEFAVAGVAFLVNCLRVFKYFPAFKQLGVYSKTFAQIIYYDITKFAVLYVIVLFAFTGFVFMSLKAVAVGKPGTDSLSFWKVLLKEVRALAEGNPFDESYDAYSVGVIILIMINMFVIIVILVNILIGQLSYRYETAIEEAEIQYSIDKAKFITRLEKSRFRNRNARMAHYVEGDYVSDDTLVSELLQDWVKLRSGKTDDSKSAIKTMMSKVLKTKEKDD